MSKGLYDGLKFIFEDYLIPDSIVSEGSAKVIDYYKNLKEIYGYKTRIPKGAINEISGILILQEKTEEALNLLDYGITQYPESAVLMAAKSETYAQLHQKNKAIKWCKLAIKNSRDLASINKYKILLEALQR
nr:hypothetical protein [uncultured Allomuricauda sp.]